MTSRLPHITIQMPVYKEGLEGVIIPTVESLKKAITTSALLILFSQSEDGR